MLGKVCGYLTVALLGAAIALGLVAFGGVPVGIVSADSPLACADTNGNGVIDKDEAIAVVVAFMFQTPVSPSDPAPAPTSTPAPVPTATPIPSTWRGLELAAEDRCTPYNQADYRYPQSVEDQIIEALGGVYGPYTGTWFEDKTETDIEHIVARSEAHDSGLCAVDVDTRRAFARDLDNLTLASPSVNRHQKGDRDPADWLPALNECWYVNQVVEVRKEYGLTIDRAEADAIDRVLAGCASTDMIFTVRP